MQKKRVVITGGSGLLGQNLNLEFYRDYDILTLYFSRPGNCLQFNSLQINLEDFSGLESVITDFRPDYLIHTAAVSSQAAVLRSTPAHVYKINVGLTGFIADLCARLQCRMFYTSTDLVYAGYRGSFLKEDAKLAPVSFYAESKLMGEVKVRNAGCDAVILRTALLFGRGEHHTSNFFQDMVSAFIHKKPVDVFTDQFRSPLSLREAARIVRHLIENSVKETTVNFGGDKRISRAEMAELACKAGKFDSSLINRMTMAEKPGVVPVEDVSMDVSLLKKNGYKYKQLEESILDEVTKIKNPVR